MSRMPGARWLGEHGSRLMTRYDAVCVHTIVGYAPAHAAHFSVHGDGTIDQSRDTRYQSAANLEGNHRVIAIENEDHGPSFPSWSGSNVPALTPAQVAANAAILRWAHETHGVPLQLCPDSRPSSRGLAYHRQGIDGNFPPPYTGRVPGGEVWTKSFGKACPGVRRIDQLPGILALAIGGTPPPPTEDPMTEEEEQMILLVKEFSRPEYYSYDGGNLSHLESDLAVKRWALNHETIRSKVNALRALSGHPPVQWFAYDGADAAGLPKPYIMDHLAMKNMPGYKHPDE